MWPLRGDRAQDVARPDAEEAASALAVHLQAGGDLLPVQVDDIPLADGEAAFADVACSAARFYGTEIVYPQSTGYFEDHPTFGQRWVSNSRLDARRRREAEGAARPQWRDHTMARVVLTSIGVRLNPAGTPTWLPFDHVLLTGIAVDQCAVVLSHSVCAPLLLAGPAVPWLGVAIEHLRRQVT